MSRISQSLCTSPRSKSSNSSKAVKVGSNPNHAPVDDLELPTVITLYSEKQNNNQVHAIQGKNSQSPPPAIANANANANGAENQKPLAMEQTAADEAKSGGERRSSSSSSSSSTSAGKCNGESFAISSSTCCSHDGSRKPLPAATRSSTTSSSSSVMKNGSSAPSPSENSTAKKNSKFTAASPTLVNTTSTLTSDHASLPYNATPRSMTPNTENGSTGSPDSEEESIQSLQDTEKPTNSSNFGEHENATANEDKNESESENEDENEDKNETLDETNSTPQKDIDESSQKLSSSENKLSHHEKFGTSFSEPSSHIDTNSNISEVAMAVNNSEDNNKNNSNNNIITEESNLASPNEEIQPANSQDTVNPNPNQILNSSSEPPSSALPGSKTTSSIFNDNNNKQVSANVAANIGSKHLKPTQDYIQESSHGKSNIEEAKRPVITPNAGVIIGTVNANVCGIPDNKVTKPKQNIKPRAPTASQFLQSTGASLVKSSTMVLSATSTSASNQGNITNEQQQEEELSDQIRKIREKIRECNKAKYDLILSYEQKINELSDKQQIAKKTVDDYIKTANEKNLEYLNLLQKELDQLDLEKVDGNKSVP